MRISDWSSDVCSSDLVSADQSTDEIRSFDLAEYLSEIMLSLAPALRSLARPVQVDCPGGMVVTNQPGALGPIITTLVLNALQNALDHDTAAAPTIIRDTRRSEAKTSELQSLIHSSYDS